MFDKRLMQLCPESRKYIVGNVLLQWVELLLNATMIFLIAISVQNLYAHAWGVENLVPVVLISHRASTMRIADEVYTMETGRLS